VYPTNEQKLLTSLAKLGKRWRKLRRRATLEEDQLSQLTWTPQDLSDTGSPTRQHTPAEMRP